MNIKRIASLFLVLQYTYAFNPDVCYDMCVLYCKESPSTMCEDECIRRVCATDQSTTLSNPSYLLECAGTFELDRHDVIVTGSDAPKNPRTDNIYFTTLDGHMICYNEEMEKLEQIIDVKHDIHYNKSLGLGLYDIAFDRDYRINNKLYFYYASKSADPSVFYYDTISEYEFIQGYVIFSRHIKKIPRSIEDINCSGGWMKTGLKERLGRFRGTGELAELRNTLGDTVVSGVSWLAFTVGCMDVTTMKPTLIGEMNPAKSITLIYELFQPMIKEEDLTRLAPSNHFERIFSAVRHRVIACDTTLFKSLAVYCIVEADDLSRHLVKLRMNMHNMAYRENSTLLIDDLNYVEDYLLSFDRRECPITSVKIYGGHLLRGYKTNIFMSQSSCFNKLNGKFQEARLLKLYRNHGKGIYEGVTVPVRMDDTFLINTSLIGSDKHEFLYLAGTSMRSGKFISHSLGPV